MAKTRREKEKAVARRTSAKAWADKQDQGFESKSVKLPDGVTWFTLKKEGSYKIDLIPFVAGNRNPNADQGMTHFERTYYAHRSVGPNNNAYACLARNFDRKCPVCEYLAKNRDNEELYKADGPKMRHLWLVAVRVAPDGVDTEGLKVWETSHWKGFGEMLKEELETGEFEDPPFPEGYSIVLRVKEDSFQGRKYNTVSKVDIVARKGDAKFTVDDAPCLDDMIIEPDYSELKKAYLQTDDNGGDDSGGKKSRAKDEDDDIEEPSDLEDEDIDDEEPAPKKKNKPAVTDEDEDDEKPAKAKGGKKDNPAAAKGIKVGSFVDYDGDECEVKKISPAGTLLTLETEDGDTYSNVEVSKVKKIKVKEDEDEDTDDEEPAPKKKKKPVVKDDDEDLEDDDLNEDDDLEEEAPVKKTKSKAKSSDDDELDDELDEDDEEPAPKKKKKPVDEDDDDLEEPSDLEEDDLDDELEEDDEDDDDETPRKKGSKR